MQTYQHNQWTRDAFDAMTREAMIFERAKFVDRSYSGFIRTRDQIERDWLLGCIPAGNA